MRIVSPILTLASLVSGAAAAADKDGNIETKKRTIFHKIDHLHKDDTTDALLNNVKTARRQRNASRSGASVMEKKTKIKMEDVAHNRLSRRSINKKKSKKGRMFSEPSASDVTGSASTTQEKGMSKDQATEVKSALVAEEEKPTASTSGLRSTGGGEAPKKEFSFEEWEEPAAAKQAPAEALTMNGGGTMPNVQELMQQRRRNRAMDLVAKKERKAKTHDVESTGRKSGQRRVASTPESHKPNPRPGRSKVSTTDKRQKKRGDMGPRRGYDKRDLKKSKKSSNSSSGSGSSSSGSEKKCEVRLTNLTKDQWFSDIFWMVHSDKVDLPLFEYGELAFDDLALLAQDGDPFDLIDYYEDNDEGVLEVDYERGPLRNGESIVFEIPKSGSYDLLTLATAFMFANDGFVAIDAGEIKDGREWYLWGNDAGVEANTQLCWTVQAGYADFPPNSMCFDVDEDIADENDNAFPGEGYVYVHNGIHDLGDKRAVEDLLAFTCDDLDADSFVEYFQEIGFDDDFLLYDDDRGRNERDDQSFLDVLEDYDDLYQNYIVVEIALDSDNFRDFCR